MLLQVFLLVNILLHISFISTIFYYLLLYKVYLNGGIMNISKISLQSIPKIFKKASNLTFRAKTIPNDSFELSNDDKYREYNERLAKNPNTAFLYNPDLSYEQIVDELKKHPEIIVISEVSDRLGVSPSAIGDDIFDFDTLKNATGRRKIRLIDSSIERNKHALDVLFEKADYLTDFQKYRNAYDIPLSTFKYYFKLGRIERFNVYPGENRECKSHSRLIDVSNPKNANAAKLYALLHERSEYLDKVLYRTSREEKIYAPVSDLKEYGISNTDIVIDSIKKGSIDGKIIDETKDETEDNFVVNLNDTTTRTKLMQIRSKECYELAAFSKKFDIPVSDVEDSFMEGNVELFYKPLFPTDWGKAFINPTSKKNSDFLAKKLLEKAIEQEILDNNKLKAKSLQSLRMRIAWSLCTKTREIAKELADDNKILGSVLHKKDEIEKQKALLEQKMRSVIKDSDIDSDEDEEEIIESLSDYEKGVIKQFYKDMWKKAGTQEFSTALKQATAIIKQYKSQGLGSIEKPEIRELIIQYESLNNQKN